jgi:hypothetical protein
MNNILKSVKKELKSFYAFIRNDSKIFMLVKYSLAFSTVTFLLFVYMLRRDKKLMLTFSENYGYLRLLKPDVNKYEMILKNNLNKKFKNNIYHNFVKKFHAIPSGITNFGNNCYINVLLQVKNLKFLKNTIFFSVWRVIQILFYS